MTGKLNGGVYLVLDILHPADLILKKLEPALKARLAAVQIWGETQTSGRMLEKAGQVISVCHGAAVPVFINKNWELLNICKADGVHFDEIPANLPTIKKHVKRAFGFGLTCGNDLQTVKWAEENRADYISFCAMFPTKTAGSCDLVMPGSVRSARAITTLPIFISGGLTPQNTAALKQQIPFDGVAVVSGIMNAEDPAGEVFAYQQALTQKNL